MGSSQSTTEAELTERKPTLPLEDDLDHEYVTINHDEKKKPSKKYSSDPRISIVQAEEWEKELLAQPKNQLAMSALMANDIDTIVGQKVATLADTQTFSVKIALEGSPVTNQRSSGRCW